MLALLWVGGAVAGPQPTGDADTGPRSVVEAPPAGAPDLRAAAADPADAVQSESEGFPGQRWQALFLVVQGAHARLTRDLRYRIGIGSDRVGRLPALDGDGAPVIRRKWLNATVAWQPAERLTLSASYSHLLVAREKREARFSDLAALPDPHDPMPPASARGVICLQAAVRF